MHQGMFFKVSALKIKEVLGVKSRFYLTSILLVFLIGCATYETRVDNSPGRPTLYEDAGTSGSVAGVGIESQDITSMTDKMMRDMLSTTGLAGRPVSPRVIIDDKYFVNESASVLNKKLITERLMVNLNRASAGRMIFVERTAAEMVETERKLKREGVLSDGTMGNTARSAGADFRLTGRIMSMDSVKNSAGITSRYHQISFKMVDLETGEVIWTGIYEFKKASQDDIIYR